MKKKNNYRELLIMNNQIKGKVFFYIRVSTKHQNEQLQLDAAHKFIKENNIEDPKIYIDKQTGTNTDRPDLQAMLKAVGKGDLVWIWALDRLSRNYNDCQRLWRELTEKGADIIVDKNKEILDTRKYKDLVGNFVSDLVVTILSYVGQQETELRAERAKAGVKAMPISKQMTQPYVNKDGELVESHAKKISSRTNKPLGRPNLKYPKDWERTVAQQQNKEISMQEALDRLKMKKASYYKLIKQYEAENNVEILKKRKNKTL